MDNKNSWDLIKKIGDLKQLDRGQDSSVFSVTEHDGDKIGMVAKLYKETGLKGMTPEEQEAILKQYYHDTVKAKEIIERNPNPLNQSIEINGVKFSLEYSIVPQGVMTTENDGIKASVGQEFIGGLNIHLLRHPNFNGVATAKPADNQEYFLNRIGALRELGELTKNLFVYLSGQLQVYFPYSGINIKPFVDIENKKISIIITDLAGSLESAYKDPSTKV